MIFRPEFIPLCLIIVLACYPIALYMNEPVKAAFVAACFIFIHVTIKTLKVKAPGVELVVEVLKTSWIYFLVSLGMYMSLYLCRKDKIALYTVVGVLVVGAIFAYSFISYEYPEGIKI